MKQEKGGHGKLLVLSLFISARTMRSIFRAVWIIVFVSCLHSCEKKDRDNGTPPGYVQLVRSRVGTVYLDLMQAVQEIPVDKNIVIEFSNVLDTTVVRNSILLKKEGMTRVAVNVSYMDENRTVVLIPLKNLDHLTDYTLEITSSLKGINRETFPGLTYHFTTINGRMTISNITLNGQSFMPPDVPVNVSRASVAIVIDFSEALDPSVYKSSIVFSGPSVPSMNLSDGNKKVTLTNFGILDYYKRFNFTVSENLKAQNGFNFEGFENSFYTALDSTYKFPQLTDEGLLDLVQRQTFRYFYDFAHPSCGLARERNTSGDVVTTGGTGFGVMALIVGMERGYITRVQGLARMEKVLGFLETCDRYHGVWPHWLNGATGKTVPFSLKDDGGDLVETSFLIQGLLSFRQYLDPAIPGEQALINLIDLLYNAVEFDFFTQGLNALYWHWSPNYGFQMNIVLRGYNETLISYVLGAGSPTHTISRDTYRYGYMDNGSILNGNTYYGITLPMGGPYGGPLFFTHYSFLGLDPRGLEDEYVNYWDQNVAHSMINWKYC
ncbi:MAG: Ig-like domain-containing protein, partial [Bacteroidales bacterium]|nr:Ig-like domain-containing protein [Bacteroidales bacterium]